MHNCRSLYLSCNCSRTSIGWADVWALAPIMAYLRYQVHTHPPKYGILHFQNKLAVQGAADGETRPSRGFETGVDGPEGESMVLTKNRPRWLSTELTKLIQEWIQCVYCWLGFSDNHNIRTEAQTSECVTGTEVMPALTEVQERAVSTQAKSGYRSPAPSLRL